MDDNEQALIELRALVAVPGALRFITNIVRDDLKDRSKLPVMREAFPHLSESTLVARLPAVAEADLKRPETFEIHEVVEIGEPDAKGRITATTAEGDKCYGEPAAVLARLREARRG